MRGGLHWCSRSERCPQLRGVWGSSLCRRFGSSCSMGFSEKPFPASFPTNHIQTPHRIQLFVKSYRLHSPNPPAQIISSPLILKIFLSLRKLIQVLAPLRCSLHLRMVIFCQARIQFIADCHPFFDIIRFLEEAGDVGGAGK
jgi:hypothetical protein